jgi:hypothetical protein
MTVIAVRAPACTKCRAEPRRKGQRWGNACFAAYEANRRKGTTQIQVTKDELAMLTRYREARAQLTDTDPYETGD